MKVAPFACALLVVAALNGPALAGSQSFPVQGNQVGFLTPSNNIECIYTGVGGGKTYQPEDGGPELSCDRADPVYLRFVLSKAGKAVKISNVGDQGCCGGSNTLQYGSTWSEGPFTCKSAKAGLTCTRDDGHGFFISKAKTKVY